MIKLYQELPREIHYLGPEDSFSGILAEQLYVDGSGVARFAQPNFKTVVSKVMADETVVGLLAIENSTSSTVHENAEHIFSGRLSVLAEAKLAIHMDLLGLEGIEKDGARIVYSHIQALAQCREYIRRRKLEPREIDSTAAAAEMILQIGDPAVVCLGAARLARRTGLTIVEEDVADHAENETKFFVVRRRDNLRIPAIPKPNGGELRITVLADIEHKKGSLWQFLRELDVEGGADNNLIESRPIPGNPHNKRFWLDLETQSHQIKKLITKARGKAVKFDVLGIYDPPKTYQS